MNTDDVIYCQPINRGIKENLSYSKTQATYDKAYCSANMTDFTDNLIRADHELMNTIPGVTVLGIKGNPKPMYQRYFPIALVFQAVVSYFPVLLWILWSTEELTIAIRYIAEACFELVQKDYRPRPMHSTPKPFPHTTPIDTHHRLEEIDCQVEHWLDQKFLSRLYIAKLVVTELLLIFTLAFYFSSKSMYVSSFKAEFVCRVDDQVLVSCIVPVARIYKLVWYTNIFILDLCILLTTLQFMNILCCMIRPRNLFFLTYMGIGVDAQLSAISDAHLISYFCHQNLRIMPTSILVTQATRAKMSKTASSTLISFGETENEFFDEGTPYYTATNTPVGTK